MRFLIGRRGHDERINFAYCRRINGVLSALIGNNSVPDVMVPALLLYTMRTVHAIQRDHNNIDPRQ